MTLIAIDLRMNGVHQRGWFAAAVRGVLGFFFGALFGLVAFYPSRRFRNQFDDGEFAVWVANRISFFVFGLGAALFQEE